MRTSSLNKIGRLETIEELAYNLILSTSALSEMKLNRESFLPLCILLLAFALEVASALSMSRGAEKTSLFSSKKENCTYRITIETTCTKGAETSKHISLRFGDTKSNDILVRRLNSKKIGTLDPLQPDSLLDDDYRPRKPFQACTIDQFQVTNKCVESPICYLYLKLAGVDDWRPGFAQVQVLEGPHLSSKYFFVRRFLPRNVWHGSDNCDREVTPFGIKHMRKVFDEKEDGK